MEGYCPTHYPDMLAARVHDVRFQECIVLQALYVSDTFGKFPVTVPFMCLIMYLPAHHLAPDFYDESYKQGAYLKTHATHMERWHSGTD